MKRLVQIIPGILRIVQAILSVSILGLSIDLAKGQIISSVPGTTVFGVFTGAFGIIAALIGVAGIYIRSLQGILLLILDGIAVIIFLAGGIAFSVALDGTHCSNPSSTGSNPLLRGGCVSLNGASECYYAALTDTSELKSRCESAVTSAALMFMGVLLWLGTACFWFWRRQEKKRTGLQKSEDELAQSSDSDKVVPILAEVDGRDACVEVEGNDAVTKFTEAEGSEVYRPYELGEGFIAELPACNECRRSVDSRRTQR